MKKSVLLFLLIFLSLYGFLHLLTAYYLSNCFTYYPVAIGLIFLLGFILTPVGYYISSRHAGAWYYFLAWLGYIWMGVFFISIWVSPLLAGISVLTDFLYPSVEDHHKVALVAILTLSFYSLYFGLQRPKIYKELIKGPGALKGLKCAQITDLHMGLLNHNRKWLQSIVDKTNSLNVDFVFLTGDLVEGKIQQLKTQLMPLADMRARLACIYVSGNHELIHGGLIWEKELQSHGWQVLHNEGRVYVYEGHKILIGGVPDRMIERFEKEYESNPDKALMSVEELSYKILLAHEPSSVFDLKAQKPDVILAGHTHGGQIFPFGFIVRMVQPVVSGWKTILGIPVYAHEGTGLWGPPMRLGSRNRIVLFEFV